MIFPFLWLISKTRLKISKYIQCLFTSPMKWQVSFWLWLITSCPAQSSGLFVSTTGDCCILFFCALLPLLVWMFSTPEWRHLSPFPDLSYLAPVCTSPPISSISMLLCYFGVENLLILTLCSSLLLSFRFFIWDPGDFHLAINRTLHLISHTCASWFPLFPLMLLTSSNTGTSELTWLFHQCCLFIGPLPAQLSVLYQIKTNLHNDYDV